MAADGYIRLTALEPRVYGDLVSPESVLFIDVPPGIRLKRLRDVSPTRLHAGAQLVVRSEHGWEDLIGLKETLRIDGPLARISHPLGQQPMIEGEYPGLDPSEVVERCRAVELRALLTFGGAVWHPEGYHYLLPSGGHATGFVRLADSMRSPHDTSCLADWVAADVSEACALIADTDTLTPLILAVQLRMARAGMSGGPVHILDHYPRTQADTDAMIREAGREAGHILFLLSVNSSGSVRDRVLRSLELAEGQFESWSLHVFVSNTPVPEGITGVHWLPLPGEDPLVDAPEAQGCHACRDPARSVVVPIDPRTFDGRLPDEVIKDTPSVTDPQRNREFFEICDSQKAIGVEEPPADAVLGFRSSERMALKVRFERLVGTEDFAELVRTKMEQVDEIRPADLVLVPEHEWNLEGFSRFRDRAMPDLVAADPEVVVSFPVDDEWPGDLTQRVRDATTITVFALGSVTGRSLQRALVSVQAAKHEPTAQLVQAVVVNARPPDNRDWQTLRNSYGHRLYALWLTRAPDRSPLVEESRELQALDPTYLPDDVAELLDERRRLAEGGYRVDDVPLFLGSTVNARLTPHSIYGQQLRAVTTFFAVASAIETQRVERSLSPPQRLTFDVRALTRSYYDPLILASALRWLRGPELWWGESPAAAGATVSEILERATPVQRGMLVPELLLAGTLGKLPAEALDVVTARAGELREDAESRVQCSVDLGLALVGRTA